MLPEPVATLQPSTEDDGADAHSGWQYADAAPAPAAWEPSESAAGTEAPHGDSHFAPYAAALIADEDVVSISST